ncbi:MAG: chemotaxis protein CheW [Aureliella sp.]
MSQIATPVSASPKASIAGTNQFLTFLVNEQEFGVEILQVQEIRNFAKLTPLPNMPACIKGVLNLRGTVVPIVDLRSRFSMPTTAYDRFTVIVVVNVGDRIAGLVVDAVSDVLDVEDSCIVDAPEMGAGVDTSFITGLAKSDERLVTLLNIERLLNLDHSLGKSDPAAAQLLDHNR